MRSNYVSARDLCNDDDNPYYREDCDLACSFYTSWSTQCPIGNDTLDPFICGPQPIRLWETD